MFITVKYGENEALVCNPACAVVNLLASIKRRAGFANTTVQLDLSDETGLVKDLDLHKYDYATKYLTSHSTYILVEKQLLPPEDVDEADGGPEQQFSFIPLLDKYTDIFPNYRLHVNQVEKKKVSGRASSKSPSPAGLRGMKGKKSSSRSSKRR